jgi:energy-coupling factor transport system ATP-binding protein
MGLKLAGIGYAYSTGTSMAQPALSGVSLLVEPGDLVLVLGATGSGKSTLMRIAAGLLEPQTGSASIDGAPLTRAAARGAVGLVFQDAESQLFAETIAADVAFGPRNLGVPAEKLARSVTDAMALVGLPEAEYGARSPFTLSGGEARRAAIAGVLAMRPRYLLLDEPTAGLDSRGRRSIRAAIAEARKSAGIVVVSHSAEEFLGEADRVLLLADGAVAFAGSARELIDGPAHFERAGLIAPDVLRVQQLALEAGHDARPFSLDPRVAAAALAQAGGWR